MVPAMPPSVTSIAAPDSRGVEPRASATVTSTARGKRSSAAASASGHASAEWPGRATRSSSLGASDADCGGER